MSLFRTSASDSRLVWSVRASRLQSFAKEQERGLTQMSMPLGFRSTVLCEVVLRSMRSNGKEAIVHHRETFNSVLQAVGHAKTLFLVQDRLYKEAILEVRALVQVISPSTHRLIEREVVTHYRRPQGMTH